MKKEKQTAVEWLEQTLKLSENVSEYDKWAFEKAKKMEKEQIVNAVYYNCSAMSHSDLSCGEQYYNETFKSE